MSDEEERLASKVESWFIHGRQYCSMHVGEKTFAEYEVNPDTRRRFYVCEDCLRRLGPSVTYRRMYETTTRGSGK